MPLVTVSPAFQYYSERLFLTDFLPLQRFYHSFNRCQWHDSASKQVTDNGETAPSDEYHPTSDGVNPPIDANPKVRVSQIRS